MLDPAENVIAFKSRATTRTRMHPKGLIEATYSAGSLAIATDDIATKTAATMLQALGLLIIEEVLADGTLRPLGRGEARKAMDRPWRLAKPPFAGEVGIPDADGVFKRSV